MPEAAMHILHYWQFIKQLAEKHENIHSALEIMHITLNNNATLLVMQTKHS